MKNHLYLFVIKTLGLILAFAGPVSGQNILTEMDHLAHQRYDRMIILSGGGDSSLHSALKPYWRNDLVILADSFSYHTNSPVSGFQLQSIYDSQNEFINPAGDPFYQLHYSQDSTGLFHYTSDSLLSRYRLSKHPLWKTFYKTPAHFYEVDVKDFYLRVNPILHVAVGY